eukprot:CAMPEP_0206188590 /NCGR_PEP_ID=MMETSP0166-20121206/3656_1 /ASSEMBLY_ACC=CAM_ASM_000260 /TAXON_ID=95228 /ORGANISM="Vannella robusta, Strain DIVA3 518/3/11/1/6" /LENGTH=265 /DNA_ID=CAMNT_0053604329 /DNA_START=126 /DNA_END=923 /DNA_ORIENTATION=-
MTWDELKKDGIPDCDAVINLTGANIMQSKWKKDGPVYTSRIDTTRDLVEAMKKNPPKTFVSASAVGIYPTNTEEVLDENSQLLDYNDMNFAQRLVYDWEQEAKKATDITRTTLVRISFVLGASQNGVAALKLPFGLGIGRIGTGKQPFPWIHEIDLAGILFHAAIDPDATSGVVNAVAPQQITQEQFATVFNRATKRLLSFPLPAVFLKPLGEKSSLLLEGPNVAPKELYNVLPSFKFCYPTIHTAAKFMENQKSGLLNQQQQKE